MFLSPSLSRRGHAVAAAAVAIASTSSSSDHLATPPRRRRRGKSSKRRMDDEMDLIVTSPTEEGAYCHVFNNNDDYYDGPATQVVLKIGVESFQSSLLGELFLVKFGNEPGGITITFLLSL